MINTLKKLMERSQEQTPQNVTASLSSSTQSGNLLFPLSLSFPLVVLSIQLSLYPVSTVSFSACISPALHFVPPLSPVTGPAGTDRARTAAASSDTQEVKHSANGVR